MTSLMCLSGEAMAQLCCLAIAIYFEARGEPLDGQFAVAEVIYNRVLDERYPDDFCSVVFDDYQFSFANNGLRPSLPSPKSDAEAKRSLWVAKELIDNGPVLGISSTHYHEKSVSPYWKKDFTFDGSYGNHIFYTNETKYR